MKVLEPLRIQSSPLRTAVDLMPARSEPADGSVMPIAATASPAAMAGSHCCFASSVPRRTMYGVVMSKSMPTELAKAIETAASSSCAMALKR